MNGSAGELNSGPTAGSTYTAKSGELQAQTANTPLAPTVNNGSGTYYNKLGFIINKGGSDASDYTYAIAASTDSFTTTYYVQSDGTLGTSQVFQSYTAWGGASGSYMVGLTPNTTYQVKVSALQGSFTQSPYGASASSTTANPSVTFSLSPSSLSLGSLLPATIVTSSTISIGFATNGANGGSVYIGGQNSGLKSTAAAYTIAAISADLSSQSSGFGAQGTAASQTSGGPLSISSPYNGSSNTVGTESTAFRQLFTTSAPLVGGSGTAVLKAKAASTTPAANDYQEVLTFLASASF